jgi:aminopeptidase N
MSVIVVAAALLCAGVAGAAEPPPDHQVTVRLEPGERHIAITDHVRLAGRGIVIFRLSPKFAATGLRVDGRDAALHRSGDEWRVELGSAGDHDLVFSYEGRLRPLPERPHGNHYFTPMAGAEGVFIPESVAWIPRPNDAPFSYRVALDVPATQKALVPGRLVAEEEADGRYRAAFVSEAPADGLVLLAGPYVVTQRRDGDIGLRTYFHPEIADLAAEYLNHVVRYLDLYVRWIGPYPFSAFHIVSSPLPVGYGYPNLTYIGTNVLKLPFIRHSSLGHEVLHNWWGNGVAADAAEGNWSEGLTTYMADYTYALQRGSTEAMEMRLGWLRDYAALPPERDRPAAAFVSKSHAANQVIGYDKVAFIFHMLRNDIGTSAFDAAIRSFWRKHKHRTAAWSDLRQAFEAAAGRRLAPFFDQWLNRAGAPKLSLGSVKVERTEKGYRTTFTLSQDEPLYALKLPMELTTEDGITRFHAALATRDVEVTVESQDRPLALAVDPEFDVFRRLDAAEAPPILRDITFDANAVVIVAAADDGTRAAARTLAERLLGVPPRFAGVTTAGTGREPLLVVGTAAEVAALLEAASLPPVPESIAGRGTARVWAARVDGRALAVVMASSQAALEALARPLPHYGRKGYLVFDGAKAIEHGNWPAGTGPLRVRLGRAG